MIFILVILISFVCSILETTIFSMSTSYNSTIKEKDEEFGKKLTNIEKDLDNSLTSILIVNTLSNTFGATFIALTLQSMYPNQETIIYYIFTAIFLVLFFGEIIPKIMATFYWKKFFRISINIVCIIKKITKPIILFTNFIPKKLKKERNNNLSREEIIHSVLESENKGLINYLESDIIENTLKLKEVKVSEVLTPRSVVFSVSKDESLKEVIEKEELYSFSRIPVYSEHIDEIIGVVYSKSLLKEVIKGEKVFIKDLIEPIDKLNENINVLKALHYMTKKKLHMVIIVDSYGQTKGILTLEDCLESVLGLEIVDETDIEEDMRQLALNKRKGR